MTGRDSVADRAAAAARLRWRREHAPQRTADAVLCDLREGRSVRRSEEPAVADALVAQGLVESVRGGWLRLVDSVAAMRRVRVRDRLAIGPATTNDLANVAGVSGRRVTEIAASMGFVGESAIWRDVAGRRARVTVWRLPQGAK